MHRYELQSGLSKEETEREETASINNFPKINYHRKGKYFFKQQYKCLKVPTQPNQLTRNTASFSWTGADSSFCCINLSLSELRMFIMVRSMQMIDDDDTEESKCRPLK